MYYKPCNITSLVSELAKEMRKIKNERDELRAVLRVIQNTANVPSPAAQYCAECLEECMDDKVLFCLAYKARACKGPCDHCICQKCFATYEHEFLILYDDCIIKQD